MPNYLTKDVTQKRPEQAPTEGANAPEKSDKHPNSPRLLPPIKSILVAALAIVYTAIDKSSGIYSAIQFGSMASNNIKKLGLPARVQPILEMGVGDSLAKLTVKPAVQSVLPSSIAPRNPSTVFPTPFKRTHESAADFEARKSQVAKKRKLMLQKQSAFKPGSLPFDAIHLLGIGLAAKLCDKRIPAGYCGKRAATAAVGAMMSGVIKSLAELMTSVDGKPAFSIQAKSIQNPLNGVLESWDKQITKDYQFKSVTTSNPVENFHNHVDNTSYLAKQLARYFLATSTHWAGPVSITPMLNEGIKTPGPRAAAKFGLGGYFPNIASIPKTVTEKQQRFRVTKEVFHEGTSCLDPKRGGPKSLHSLLTADDGTINPLLDQAATVAENTNQLITLPAKMLVPFVIELSEAVLSEAMRFAHSVSKDYHRAFKSGEAVDLS